MERIREVIDLIELTGDKCVILHQEKSAYVVMKMEDYRALVQKQREMERSGGFSRPLANIQEFEVPRLSKEEDFYYPEPLI
ncbi:MAG TPA: hypothetical protein VJC08_02065 [bacterium]|uniref:Antitoxin n=1 Tax=Candidatus Komeilibacteria bacterium RIFCSPLOWO2_01_FULL_45_10 TaxID=1798550 RepID=A0A1G2BJ20_9BACT|nr:MAG: hypothetical protein A2927_01750 [Candidatus Komeilibacteria bacterium RIFCSPLOWO2_01_FULL_45_10]HLD49964.1 hypothetical protein [bacterium]